MEIVKTLVVKTKENEYTFDLTKNTYSFWYEHDHAETKGRFSIYEFNGKDQEEVVREQTDYVKFYINNTKSFSFTKNKYHDFQSLELRYRNVAITGKIRYSFNTWDQFTIFKADNFSINLANELTFVKTKESNLRPDAFLSYEACDFGVFEVYSGKLINVIDIAKLIVEGFDFLYKDEEGDWQLALSDKGKGLISKYRFVNS